MLKNERSVEATIVLVVNGRSVSSVARRLGDLVAQQGLGDARVATALNGAFVPAGRRDMTALSPGDRVEIVSARQGG